MLQTRDSFLIAKQSNLGYFMAIKKAKASYWADVLTKTITQNIWTAKQFVAPRNTPRFPSLLGASDPFSINKAFLDYLFPPKDLIPAMGSLSRDPSAEPHTSEENKYIVMKSSSSLAPGPDSIPFSVWKRVNLISSWILLDHLSPLVAFGYHSPSSKDATA